MEANRKIWHEQGTIILQLQPWSMCIVQTCTLKKEKYRTAVSSNILGHKIEQF
jgi:hypothetical protein